MFSRAEDRGGQFNHNIAEAGRARAPATGGISPRRD